MVFKEGHTRQKLLFSCGLKQKTHSHHSQINLMFVVSVFVCYGELESQAAAFSGQLMLFTYNLQI